MRAPVATRRNPSPVLQSTEHDLDVVAAFVAALVVFDWLSERLRPGMQGFIPLSFNASLNQSAS